MEYKRGNPSTTSMPLKRETYRHKCLCEATETAWKVAIQLNYPDGRNWPRLVYVKRKCLRTPWSEKSSRYGKQMLLVWSVL